MGIKKIFCLTLITFSNLNVHGQNLITPVSQGLTMKEGSGSHGGDTDAIEFLNLAEKFCYWVKSVKNTRLFQGIEEEACLIKIQQARSSLNLDRPIVTFEDKQENVMENGVQKNAIYSESGEVKILRSEWSTMSLQRKYTIISIEMSGLLGQTSLRYSIGDFVWNNWNSINKTSIKDNNCKVFIANKSKIDFLIGQSSEGHFGTSQQVKKILKKNKKYDIAETKSDADLILEVDYSTSQPSCSQKGYYSHGDSWSGTITTTKCTTKILIKGRDGQIIDTVSESFEFEYTNTLDSGDDIRLVADAKLRSIVNSLQLVPHSSDVCI